MVPGSETSLKQVGLNPTRTGFLRCLEAMGTKLSISNQNDKSTEPVGDIRLEYSSGLKGIDVPESWVPDMIDE